MKQIIDGKVYNTETATEICSYQYSCPRDFSYYWETLYVTKKGAYFIHGEGGPNSKYSVTTGLNEWSGSVQIRPVSKEEAREFTEENASYDTYTEFFGTPEEA